MAATQPDGSIARLRQRSSSETTVAFADLAGFTALTGAYSDDDAIAVTRRFEATVRSVLAEPESFVKLIGNTALLVFTEPQQAILALVALLDEAGHDLLPAVRIGIHTGRVKWSDREPCGPVVKLASRVAALAGGSQILATWSVARLLPPGAWLDLGPVDIRGSIDPVRLVEVSTSTTPSSVDPVCQMRVTRGHGAATVVHDGRRWELCSIACARRFTVAPDLYLAQMRDRDPITRRSEPNRIG